MPLKHREKWWRPSLGKGQLWEKCRFVFSNFLQSERPDIILERWIQRFPMRILENVVLSGFCQQFVCSVSDGSSREWTGGSVPLRLPDPIMSLWFQTNIGKTQDHRTNDASNKEIVSSRTILGLNLWQRSSEASPLEVMIHSGSGDTQP